MSAKGTIKCCCCGIYFRPDIRNRHRQRYCSKAKCRLASKHASQQKWCRKNRNYFQGSVHVQRVQLWREQHPHYWRKSPVKAQEGCGSALQDILKGADAAQTIINKGFAESQDACMLRKIAPLQDIIVAQNYALVGIISMLSGTALQDHIDQTLQACYHTGKRIGGMVPWMRTLEGNNGNERLQTDSTAPPAAHPPTV